MKNSKEKLPYNPEITKEDQKILGDVAGNVHTGTGEDTNLQNRTNPIDFEGKDLDVPGRELPKDREVDPTALKDEENQLYSQGGPGNHHLE